MTITVGENSYVTEAELTDYAEARGKAITGDTEQVLIQAMDFIETRPYAGYKTDSAQELQFPRDGATVVPADIKTAQIVAAMLIDSGVDFFATTGRAIKSKKIAGVIETEYMDNAAPTESYPQLDNLLEPFYGANAGSGFEVIRG
jgi:hypothetical protein